MKVMSVLLCLVFGFQSFAEMISKSRMKEIAQNAETFKKDCTAFSKEKKIKIDNVKNFTSDQLDSKNFGKLLGKELKIKNKKESGHVAQLQAVLRSKVFEQSDKRTTIYTLQLALNKDSQELCQQQYVSEFVDKLTPVQ